MDEAKTSENKSFMVPGSIILAGIVIAAAVIYSNGGFNRGGGGAAPGGGSPAGNQAGIGNAPVSAPVEDGDDPSLGDPQAPVTMVEFSDFQCPFCGRFFSESEQKIIDKYVKTGKVRFVYRDFAFLGPESEYAAVAAECANAQGKFWDFHNYLFNHQSGENQGAFAKDKLKGFAKALGLNTSQFSSCLDADKSIGEARKDGEDGRAIGFDGTPSFVIGKTPLKISVDPVAVRERFQRRENMLQFDGGILVVGALPFEQFDAAIQAALGGK